MANKIRFGLKNTHYSIVTETVDSTTGAIESTYTTPAPWKGSVSISLDPQGEDTPFYADDGVYVMLNSNTGYQGDFTSAQIPDEVETNVFGQTKDATTGMVTEKSTDTKKYIALMFEFDGDATKRRWVMYRCMLTRPSIASETSEASITPHTVSLTITATPRPDDNSVQSHVDEGDSAYTNWYSAVPTAE